MATILNQIPGLNITFAYDSDSESDTDDTPRIVFLHKEGNQQQISNVAPIVTKETMPYSYEVLEWLLLNYDNEFTQLMARKPHHTLQEEALITKFNLQYILRNLYELDGFTARMWVGCNKEVKQL